MENNQKKEKKWIINGHIIRNNEQITTVIERKIERESGIGRLKTLFMKQIIEDRGKFTYKEIKIIVVDRDE